MSTTTKNVMPVPPIPDGAKRWMAARAQQIASGFGYSEADDLLQEVWLWILTSKTGRRGWWQDGEFNDRLFRLDVDGRLFRAATADRDAVLGPRDTFGIQYSAKEVEYLLGELWTRGILPSHGDDGPAVSTSVDHSKGPDLPAKIADLSKIYHRAVAPGSASDEILFRLYGLGQTQREAAQSMGLSQPTVHLRKEAAILDITKALNHTSWGRTWNDPTEWNDGPGTKTIMSNAQAVAGAEV